MWKDRAMIAVVLAASTVHVCAALRKFIPARSADSDNSAVNSQRSPAGRHGYRSARAIVRSGNVAKVSSNVFSRADDEVANGSLSTGRDIADPLHKTSAAGGGQPREAQPPIHEGGEESKGSGLQSMSTWLGIVGLFVAPTTLVTGVCYFFGSIYTHRYFSFFGIDADAIGFTTTDYVVRSINVIMFPVVGLLIACGLVLIADAYAHNLAKAGRWVRLIHAVGWTANETSPVSCTPRYV
jgi:hypothetical protein